MSEISPGAPTETVGDGPTADSDASTEVQPASPDEQPAESGEGSGGDSSAAVSFGPEKRSGRRWLVFGLVVLAVALLGWVAAVVWLLATDDDGSTEAGSGTTSTTTDDSVAVDEEPDDAVDDEDSDGESSGGLPDWLADEEGADGEGSAEADEVEDLVEEFIDAASDDDCATMARLVTEDAREGQTVEEATEECEAGATDEDFARFADMRVAGPAEIDDDTATVEVEGSFLPEGATMDVVLVREDGTWLIDEFGAT